MKRYKIYINNFLFIRSLSVGLKIIFLSNLRSILWKKFSSQASCLGCRVSFASIFLKPYVTDEINQMKMKALTFVLARSEKRKSVHFEPSPATHQIKSSLEILLNLFRRRRMVKMSTDNFLSPQFFKTIGRDVRSINKLNNLESIFVWENLNFATKTKKLFPFVFVIRIPN